jgi:hypothetical protein
MPSNKPTVTSIDTTVFSEVAEISSPVPMFSGHELQPVNSAPVPLPERVPDWFTVLLLSVVIFFAWVRLFYYKVVKQLMAAFFSNNISNQLVRDENILVQRASILLSFVFYFTGSLFLYQVSEHYNWDYPFLGEGLLRLVVLLLIVAFTYSLKMVMVKGLGELFDMERPVATYLFNISLMNNMLGMVLFPLVVLAAYVVSADAGWVILTGIAMVIIMFIYRLVRAFMIWTSLKGVPFFYLILYFCTLEIAPVMIIIKLAGG